MQITFNNYNHNNNHHHRIDNNEIIILNFTYYQGNSMKKHRLIKITKATNLQLEFTIN